VILLFLLLLLAPQEKPAEKCVLSGSVVDAVTGEPLSKVRILAEGNDDESGATPATTSDAKGQFTLIDINAGRYRLRGRRNGYLDGYYGARHAQGNGTPIALEAGQQFKNLVLKLTPAGVIAGTVRDADGEPLSRITITVHRVKYREGRRRIVLVGGAYADDLGQYRIPDLPPGRYYVYADSKKAREFGQEADPPTADHSPKDAPRALTLLPAVYPSVQEVGPGSRITGVDIMLPRSATVAVKGRVTPPPGMQVNNLTLQNTESETDELGLRLVTGANDKGEFQFREVPPGNYTLIASAVPPAKPFNGTFEMFPENLKTRMPVQVDTTDLTGLRIAIAAGAQISGRIVVDGDEKAKLGSNLIEFNDGGSDAVSAFVLDDNTFKLALAPGHYLVNASDFADDLVVRSMRAGGRDILTEGLVVSEPGKVAIEIVLAHDGGKVEGTVLSADEKAVAGATILLVPESRLRSRTDLFHQGESDQYGRFSFTGIAPGEYKVFAWDDVEPGIWWDPEFLKKYESQGETVKVDAKGKVTTKVHLGKE
jgi:hypothetical protein